MSWENEGEYRIGTVEMMNSPSVVVAYLSASEPMELENGLEWSNKKWRELFVVNKDIITGVKQYPYKNSNIEKAVADWLRELAEKNLEFEYVDNYFEYKTGKTLDIPEVPQLETIRFFTNMMYNDFHSTNHYAYVNKDINKNYSFHYSGAANCMWCGETNGFDSECDLVCYYCNDSWRCCECGERYHNSDYYEIDGNYYCEYCYSYVASDCPICEDTHLSENLYQVYLVMEHEDGKRYIHNNLFINICDDCFYRLKDGNFYGILRDYFKDKIKIYNYEYYIDEKDLTEDGLNLFTQDGFIDLEEEREKNNYSWAVREIDESKKF